MQTSSPSAARNRTFLPADQAFALNVHAVDQHTLIASFKITPSYYLYRDKISFTTADRQNQNRARRSAARAKPRTTPISARLEVYHQSFQAQIVLDKVDATKPLVLNASYQGCSDKGCAIRPSRRRLTSS